MEEAMTDTEIRIAIAEACGWKRRSDLDYTTSNYGDTVLHHVWEKDGRTCNEVTMSDYLNDLNAMHEAEKMLSANNGSKFVGEVWGAICRYGTNKQLEIGTIHSSARQRAEAFLRTIGKWKE
jgi:hypothetical protein